MLWLMALARDGSLWGAVLLAPLLQLVQIRPFCTELVASKPL